VTLGDSALSIAEDVRLGRRSAVEVLESYLAVIDATEKEIHAFNLVTRDHAFVSAQEVDEKVSRGLEPGPLAGVPIAYKDNLCTWGVETTCSSRMLEGWKPPYNATVVDRMSAAGAVMIGKTNLDEFAMGSSTENSAFGPTRNPVDVSRVPGGSSGGSAAAVAAGFAPLALGSDTGGSIRQPAALCGVVGVKPTYGLVSRFGLIAFASSFDQIGPFANNVADAAVALEVLAGQDLADSTCIPHPGPKLLAELDRGVEGLRVGIVRELLDGSDEDVALRVHQAAEALIAAGAFVDEVSVPAVEYGLTAYYLIAPAEASSNLARYDGVRYGLRREGSNVQEMNALSRRDGFGDEVIARIMLGTFALSAGYYDAYYGKAQKIRSLIRRDFDLVYADHDLLLSPTSPSVAFKFGERSDPMSMYRSDVCTIPSNLVGDASMSVPFGNGLHNMPVGVQLMAPALGEALMFRAAAVLELAEPAEEVHD
jgi:aspartyl-tRNA(Asn)/glutamyl-tRNA(Gln) amidotransferase subunit A